MPFNRPYISGHETEKLEAVIQAGRFAGPGPFGAECEQKLGAWLGTDRVLLTSSCTHALEMCALLLDIQSGDEVIMPSFTFVSAANAFVLRGARVVFVDIRLEDMNINPTQVEAAITPKTKAILVMHYAGMACDMDALLALSRKHGLYLIEDAAHCVGATYQGQSLGTFGDLATFSFHESKNLQCGEGGALVVNRASLMPSARRIREKGTNRPAFLRGEVSFYEWTDVGSSYILGELSAAFLSAQLEDLPFVTETRRHQFAQYREGLKALEEAGQVFLPKPLAGAHHNGHIFFLRLTDASKRNELSEYLEKQGISAYFHYIPLHASGAGKRYSRFEGVDRNTTSASESLLRLPVYPGLRDKDIERIVQGILLFFSSKNS
ncbi:MAG: dTDP-4-amino-4,6-dideoxygalactose transaminase [Bacteroidetes bacterium]|nr:dTDP-4-amino-4,6-dideoxygalactose transaminase [Bacteroidota bacterium]